MTARTKQSTVAFDISKVPSVSDQQARDLYQRDKFRKDAERLAKRAKREGERRAKEERIANAMRAAQKKSISLPSTPVQANAVPSKFGVVIQAEGLGKSYLDAIREREAHHTAQKLYAWMEERNPPLELIKKEFEAALFVPIVDSLTGWSCEGVVIHTDQVERELVSKAHQAKGRVLRAIEQAGANFLAKIDALKAEGFEEEGEDPRGNAIYARCGVTVTLFGSATKAQEPHKQFGRRLTPEQLDAAERRAKGGKFNLAREVCATSGIGRSNEKKPRGTPSMSVEEIAKAQAKNAELRAKGKADRRKAKAPVVKTPKVDSDKKGKKGGADGKNGNKKK